MLPDTQTLPLLTRLLDKTGDGTGVTNANVDASGTAQVFKISPPSTGWIKLHRMLVVIRDAGAFSAEKYGVLATLTNGVQVGMLDNSTGAMVQTFTPAAIKENASWGQYCYDVELKEWGAGDKFLLARWTFEKAGVAVKLYPGGNAFGVIVNDDLTGLVSHYFTVQGHAADGTQGGGGLPLYDTD